MEATEIPFIYLFLFTFKPSKVFPWHIGMIYPQDSIQLFRQRLSKKSVKAYATMPKGSLGNTQYILNKHVKSSESILFLLTQVNKYS